MIYVAAAELGDGAIVDLSLASESLLRRVCRWVFEAVGSDQVLARTGYPPHAYEYLYVWLLEHRSMNFLARRLVREREAVAALERRLGSSATASELLLATRIGDSGMHVLRVKFNREALVMFDAAFREVLGYFTSTIGREQEFPLRSRTKEEDLHTIRQQIKDILAAADPAAQQVTSRPSAASATTPGPVRSDDESAAGSTDMVNVELTGDEQLLLRHGLMQWGQRGRCTDAMAIAMGFDTVRNLFTECRQLDRQVERREPMSMADWTRTLLATEICFASDVVGAGLDWDATAGDNAFTFEVLRGLQRKLSAAGVRAWQRIEGSPVEFGPKDAPLVTPPSMDGRDYRDYRYETNIDELVAIELTADEHLLLRSGLGHWSDPGRCTDAMAIAMGFGSVGNLFAESRRLDGLLQRGEPLSIYDWTRTLLGTEVCFASGVLGAGLDWDHPADGDDVFTIEVLRGLQQKLSAAGARVRRVVSTPPRSPKTTKLTMAYQTATRLGDGVIIDISPEDHQLLSALCQAVGEAVGSAQVLIRTGYTKRAYDYLLLWMAENQPDAARHLADRQGMHADLKGQLGSPTDDELSLATKIGDSDVPTVRWRLSVDALKMFDAGIREVLRYFASSPGLLLELPLRTGYDGEDFRTVQQHIKGILADVESAAEQAGCGPSVVSVTTPGPYAISVPAGTTGIVFELIGGGGGGGAYVANGDLTSVPRGSRGESTTAVVQGIGDYVGSAPGGYGGISTDYPHPRDASWAVGQSPCAFTPALFPKGFVIPGGIGGAAGNNSPGGDGGAPGAGGGPGVAQRDQSPSGSYGGSGGFSGEHRSGLVWLPDDPTESAAIQITGVVGAGGAGDPGADDGAVAGGKGGGGAAYFTFREDAPPPDALAHANEQKRRYVERQRSLPIGPAYVEWEPLFIRRAEFKLPRMRSWPDDDWDEDTGADPSS
ncbi:hypothetical protein [Mycobacterium camsae]|uniref:hypothetical protein n=1 Tax=Mycobacterium gordonae TaxID=1778 RepID=UPI0019809758|nr:hypothetical protein [Mycobacterium gordonae]